MARPNWEYIRVDVLLPDNPKLDGLPASAKWTLIVLWCYCGQHLTDGFVRAAKWPKFGTKRDREALVAAELANPVPGGYQLHDYLEHQRSRAEVEELRTARAKAGRKGGQATAAQQARATARATANATDTQPVDNAKNAASGRQSRRNRPKKNQKRPPVSSPSSNRPPRNNPRPGPRDPKQELQHLPQQNASKSVAEAEAEADQSMADVEDQSPVGDAREDLIDLIINELRKATGRTIDRQWAAKTQDFILNGRSVSDPAAYIRSAIHNEPNPATRFLPLY